ncbi:diguanylate cyclase [Telmatospirillum sp.]|uniref:GGDEF domain-containing protein n=1 Tax=Telmatospirillum sp. TaxID=2079197 RepID=UPI00284C2C11|nr:diguanylate cyclase [Telmatospirillum sp.]MDR3439699.1 diguanylate cyclase [Telmatospirillum sp.]
MPPRSFSVRQWLTLLLATCIIPVWIGAVWTLDRATNAKRDLIEAELLHSARILSLVLEGKIASVRSTLQSLASSPSLDNGDFAAFHRQTRLLAADIPEADIILTAPDTQQLTNSFLPFGTPLPRRSRPDMVAKTFETGRPLLRSHFKGALTGRPLIGIDVPVIRNGKVLYDLGITLPCQVFSTVLEQTGLPASWVAGFIDDTGVIVGRNVDADRFVGQKTVVRVTPGERIFESPTIDGIATLVAVVGSPDTGWGVVVGVPKAVIDSDVRWWRGWMLAGIAGLTLLGTAVALVIGYRIASAIEALVAPAIHIGHGDEVVLPRSPIAETQNVADALANASQLLKKRLKDLEESHRRERESLLLASTDALTGLPNRRRFDEVLTSEYARHTRSGAELSLIMLDVDHFKAFNDTYGHVAGDDCLRQVARIIGSVIVRASDFAARYGGEEFACILPATDQSGAVAIAERIRLGISHLAIPHGHSGVADHVTVSLGVVTGRCIPGETALNVVTLADEQLYAAKSTGRNRSCAGRYVGWAETV